MPQVLFCTVPIHFQPGEASSNQPTGPARLDSESVSQVFQAWARHALCSIIHLPWHRSPSPACNSLHSAPFVSSWACRWLILHLVVVVLKDLPVTCSSFSSTCWWVLAGAGTEAAMLRASRGCQVCSHHETACRGMHPESWTSLLWRAVWYRGGFGINWYKWLNVHHWLFLIT